MMDIFKNHWWYFTRINNSMYFMSPTAHINKKFSSPKYNCLKNLYFQDLWSNSQTNLIKKEVWIIKWWATPFTKGICYKIANFKRHLLILKSLFLQNHRTDFQLTWHKTLLGYQMWFNFALQQGEVITSKKNT